MTWLKVCNNSVSAAACCNDQQHDLCTHTVRSASLQMQIFSALIIGIVWGIFLEGTSSLMAGVLIVVCVNVWFIRSYLRIEDEDEYGGIITLLQEGAFPAAATFLVRISWPGYQPVQYLASRWLFLIMCYLFSKAAEMLCCDSRVLCQYCKPCLKGLYSHLPSVLLHPTHVQGAWMLTYSALYAEDAAIHLA